MGTTGNFTIRVSEYRSLDATGVMPVKKIAEELGWSHNEAYVFKFFISELSTDELTLLDGIEEEIDLEIIKAISLQQPDSRTKTWTQIHRILQAQSPFMEIDRCMQEAKGRDPLLDVRKNYWICVGDYLKERNIDQYPFTKKAIYLIKGIGFKGYESQSVKQKEWIYNLIDSDKKRPEHDRFFINEHVLIKGYKKECGIIKDLRSEY